MSAAYFEESDSPLFTSGHEGTSRASVVFFFKNADRHWSPSFPVSFYGFRRSLETAFMLFYFIAPLDSGEWGAPW